jgi:MOSC domain-containing protein YiiM
VAVAAPRAVGRRPAVSEPARVVSVNVVHRVIPGHNRLTAIDKRPVDGPVEVGELGLDGDRQCDTRHHGGLDKALYVYALEDNTWWSGELGRPIRPGTFGENLTTEGLDVNGALIGERWRIGGPTGPLVEVRMPRTPCANLSARMGIPRFHLRFDDVRRIGAYLRVLNPGVVTVGATVDVVDRPHHGVTIASARGGADPAALRRMLDSEVELADDVARMASRRIARSVQA